MKIYTLLLFLSSFCFSSDKSDQIPKLGNNAFVNNVCIANNSPRPSKILRPGPRHPVVQAAHEEAQRIQEENKTVKCCCCFIKFKKAHH